MTRSVTLAGLATVTLASLASNAENLTQSHALAEEAPQKYQPKPKLVQLQLIFRHGARTPVFRSKFLENISFNVCKGINRPPGVDFDVPPATSGVIFAHLNLTGKDGSTARPYSKVDSSQASSGLKGGECRVGQLTEIGAYQAAELGRSLRERYKGLIPIDSSNLEARTTNVARCIGTLSAMLGSFLDLSNESKETGGKLVIPVKTVQNNNEYMTPNVLNCEYIYSLFLKGRKINNEKLKDIDSESSKLLKYLMETLPTEVLDELKVNKNNFVRINDWITILKTHRKQMNANEIKATSLDLLLNDNKIVQSLSRNAAIEVARLIGTKFDKDGCQLPLDLESKKSLKFAIGLFLKELHNNLFDETEQKIRIYSGHDTTIVPLLLAFEIFDSEWSDYCSNIAIELWDLTGEVDNNTSDEVSQAVSDPSISNLLAASDNHRYEVRILYNGTEKRRMKLIEFTEYCKDLTPKTKEDWYQDCIFLANQQRSNGEKNDASGGSTF